MLIKKNGATLFWMINDLRFGAKPGATGYNKVQFTPSPTIDCSYTRFNADAYISTDGNLFKKICTVDTVFLVLNMGGGHGPDLENALRVLLKKTMQTAGEAMVQNTEILTIEQVAEISKQRTTAPILSSNNYQEGAYANFAEFLANSPSIKNYEAVVGKKKKVYLVNASDTLNVWGVCKNGELYKYYEQSLVPLEKRGSGFVIAGYVENTNRNNKNMFNLGMAASIAGGVLLNTAAILTVTMISGKPLLVETIPHISEPQMQPLATCIDMRTGYFSF